MNVRLKVSIIAGGEFYRIGTVMPGGELPEFARGKESYYEEVPPERPPSPSLPPEPIPGEGSQPKRLSRRG
jgi:hypothetical protein